MMSRHIARLALPAALIGIAAISGHAAAARFPVTLADVAAALAAQRPELPVSGLDMPTITASSPEPVLIVGVPRAAGPRTAEVRIACRETVGCLPFYVRVHCAEPNRLVFAENQAEVQATTYPAPRPRQRPQAAVRSGARAELHIDSGRLHISLPVICLTAGRLGGEIRVTGLDHRMFYTARIVSPTLMEGTL